MSNVITKKMQDPSYHNRTCPICNKTFYTYPSNIKLGRGIFCSVKCKSIAVGMKFKGKNNQKCLHCGKMFHVRQCRIINGKGVYCSSKCRTLASIKRTTTVCKMCEKEFIRTGAQKRGKKLLIFCSNACRIKWYSGDRSPTWQGGISFEPYCPKFNDDLRQRIRAFFDYECIACGKHTTRQLNCHHVEYNKLACCDGEPIHFAALCNKHHAMTNHDRARWEAMLHRIIDEIYGGRSYYTKEEWDALRRKE